jgi:lipoyl-dependent peroxiredoxin subunit D
MSMLGVVKKLPDYAEDIRKNLLDIFENGNLSLEKKELFGVALTICYALGHEQLLNGVRAEAKFYLEDVDAKACKVAATIMAMTNKFYSFVDYIPDYKGLESKLISTSLKNPEIPKKEMEMYCLAVSILNSCKPCTIEISLGLWQS